MPIFEYECPNCKKRIEVVEPADHSYGAPVCGCKGKHEMVRVEFSVPARTRVGKYGKAGGLPPEGHDG